MALKNDDLKSIVESAVTEAGGNRAVGYELAANKVEDLMIAKKISASDFSIKEMYRTLVDPTLSLTSAKAIAEAIQSSAFPNLTTKVMTQTVIPAYEMALGNIANLVTEDDAIIAGTNPVPGLTAADGPELRRQGMAYKEGAFGEKYCEIDTGDIGEIIELTRETIFNDRTNSVINKAKSIAGMLASEREKMTVQTIEMTTRSAFQETSSRAFVLAGTAYTSAQFYANTHATVMDLQVNDNLDITDVDKLSSDGVDATANLFASMLDEKGQKININANQIVVPKKLFRKAWQLFNSSQEFDTGNNALNYFKGMYEVYTSNYLTTAYNYFLGDFKKQLLWLWVWKPETESQGAGSDLAFERQIVYRIRISMNGGVGHTDYKYIAKGGSTA